MPANFLVANKTGTCNIRKIRNGGSEMTDQEKHEFTERAIMSLVVEAVEMQEKAERVKAVIAALATVHGVSIEI